MQIRDSSLKATWNLFDALWYCLTNGVSMFGDDICKVTFHHYDEGFELMNIVGLGRLGTLQPHASLLSEEQMHHSDLTLLIN